MLPAKLVIMAHWWKSQVLTKESHKNLAHVQLLRKLDKLRCIYIYIYIIVDISPFRVARKRPSKNKFVEVQTY